MSLIKHTAQFSLSFMKYNFINLLTFPVLNFMPPKKDNEMINVIKFARLAFPQCILSLYTLYRINHSNWVKTLFFIALNSCN